MSRPTRNLLNPTAPLTPNQSRLLKYVLDHRERVVFLTTAQLAQASAVSEATVVRLAQVLGYSGYKEMKQDLGRLIMNRLDTVERLKSSAEGIHSVGDLMSAVIRQDTNSLATLSQTLDGATLSEVARILHEASLVYLVGLRSAYSLAVFLQSGLTLLGKQVRILKPGTWELWREVGQVGRGDILVAISFPRYTRLTVQIVEAARRAGAKVISLTDSTVSPLAPHSDHLLCAPCRIDSFIESYVAASSVLNALITGIGFLKGTKAIEHLQKMEQIWDKQRTYHQIEVRSLPSWAGASEKANAKTDKRKKTNS